MTKTDELLLEVTDQLEMHVYHFIKKRRIPL